MKRKTTLILASIGIFIIIVTLVSFTYAFYSVKITENEEEKSVDVVIVNKSLEYKDLSETETSEIIAPGYQNKKYFTVHNTGSGKVNYHIYLTDVVNNFTKTEEIKYTLYRKAGNNTITDKEKFTDCELVTKGIFPKENTYVKTNEIIENPNGYYTYVLKTEYINAEYNQDVDQGKTFSSKVQIHSEVTNEFDEGTLAYEIIKNSVNLTTEQTNNKHAQFMVPTLTEPAANVSAENESTLSVTNDNVGVSYYYRGNVKNNYLELNNMCFRIVRIEGDGSVKVTLAAQKSCKDITDEDINSAFIGMGTFGTKSISFGIKDGYEVTRGLYPDYETSNINETSFMFPQEISTIKNAFNIFINGGSFQSALYNENGEPYDENWQNYGIETKNYSAWNNNIKNKIKFEKICIGDTSKVYNENGEEVKFDDEEAIYYFDNYFRLEKNKNITLNCQENALSKSSYQVYPLTIDEILIGGSYLKVNAKANYVTSTVVRYESMVPYTIIYKDSISSLFYTDMGDALFRPTLSLIPNIELSSDSGDGTINSPYKVG